MRIVEFRRLLSNINALRVQFEIKYGQVEKFVVQLETDFGDGFVPVVRYDTAHGFAHCDRLHPYEPELKTRLDTNSYNDALTFAMNDLEQNWQEYVMRYETWLKRQ